MGTPTPDSVKRLVDHFNQNRKVFQLADYKEEQLRAEFLNPFFESLGWDVANKAGLTEVFKPVIHDAGGSQLTAYSPQLSDSNSGPSAASRWPLALAIGSIYYPDCPYEFSVLPADILGQVYEQFLGKVIRLTAGHQAKVKEKPERLIPAGPMFPALVSERRPAFVKIGG
jgi:hypothetical protein